MTRPPSGARAKQEVLPHALSFSGGKDSTLALDRAIVHELDVAYLFNIYEGSSGRVRFHGVRAELIQAQADSFGIPLIQRATHPDDYETIFLRILNELKDLGVEGIIFGNIHLEDIRGWYEERVKQAGLRHVEPIWREPGLQLVREFVARGYRARLVSIDLAKAPEAWLGRDLDEPFFDDLQAHAEVDPSGERGEYHTFVYDGPLFGWPIPIQTGRRIEMEGHALLDLQTLER